MPTITGTSGADTLTGTDQDDVINALAGDDVIRGGGGADRIDGGSNNDTIFGEDGDDTVTLYRLAPVAGSDPATRLGNGASTVDGGAGRDTLSLTAGTIGTGLNIRPVGFIFRQGTNDVNAIAVFTNDYPDTTVVNAVNFEVVTGSSEADLFFLQNRSTAIEIHGGAGNDGIFSGTAADLLYGGDGDDVIDVGRGDRAYGDAGQDTFQIGSSVQGLMPTLIDGGAGVDTLVLELRGAIDLTLVNGAVTFGTITTASIENIALQGPYGTSTPMGVISIRGDDNANLLTGAFTADQVTGAFIDGGGGADTINLNARNSRILGGTGDDILTSVSASTGSLNNEMRGGTGNDRITGSGQLFGDEGDDFINAGQQSVVRGGTGNDTMFVGGDAFGDEGDDWALVKVGTFDGGDGNDTYQVGWQGGVTVDLTQGSVRTELASDGIVVRLTSVENVAATQYADTLTGDGRANRLTGGGGADTLYGGGGDDVLFGDGDEYPGGADRLFGDEGDDVLRGGAGDDTLDGGVGLDTADYADSRLNLAVDLRVAGPQNTIGAGMDTLISIESVTTGLGNDTLSGDDRANTLRGGAGDDVLRGAGGDDTLEGGIGVDTAVFAESRSSVTVAYQGGDVIITGAGGRDTLRGIEALQFADGAFDIGTGGQIATEARRTLTGTAGNDVLIGGGSRDTLSGGAGDDFLIGGGSGDAIDGGAGIDTAVYSGLARSYAIVRGNGANAGVVSISDGLEGGTDTLTLIERLSFLDGVRDMNPNGAAAQVYRLYDAALDRAPDQVGLSGWVGRLASGTTLGQAAQAFATAPEFVQRYGALNNEDFVKTMYRFSLNREGDAFGVSQWKGQLDLGVSRGDVLLAFSESAEHRTLTSSAISAGLFVQDDRTIAVARLYDAAFDRAPDQGGLAFWRGTLDTGGSLFAIANAFVSSQEFQDRYGALSNSQFIDQLYRFTLNREADAFGRQVWIDRLNAGTSRAEMVVIFSESVEHVNLTAATWQGGVRYEGYVEPMGAVGDATAGKSAFDDAFVLPALPHDTAADAAMADDGHDASMADARHGLPADQHLFVDPWAAPFDVAMLPGGGDLSAGHRHSDWI